MDRNGQMDKQEQGQEQWKAIEGFEFYEVSDLGRVRSLDKEVVEKTGKRYKRAGRVLKDSPDGSGYPMVSLFNEEGCNKRYVHRLVVGAFIGFTEEQPWVNHKNANKADNRLSNLERCSPSENNLHAYATGLKVAPRGIDHSKTFFTRAQVLEIKMRIQAGENIAAMAREMDVNKDTLYAIRLGRTWGHIGPDLSLLTLKDKKAKLTDKDVKAIKSKLRKGASGSALAREYGVTPTNISAIKRGITWKHVQ